MKKLAERRRNRHSEEDLKRKAKTGNEDAESGAEEGRAGGTEGSAGIVSEANGEEEESNISAAAPNSANGESRQEAEEKTPPHHQTQLLQHCHSPQGLSSIYISKYQKVAHPNY